MKRVALAILLIYMQAGPAGAGWDEAAAAYERGDYETAAREYRALAEQGNAKAQLNLGILYSVGMGVPEDDAEAVKWYRLAAEQGEASAQLNLGLMYSVGLGVSQDYAEAASRNYS